MLEVWGDESGDLNFSTLEVASSNFVTACVVTTDKTLAHDVLKLRQRLAIAGHDMPEGLHCNAYPAVREDVFRFLRDRQITAYASTYNKLAVDTHLKRNPNSFLTMAWRHQLRAVLKDAATPDERLPFIGIANYGTQQERSGRLKAIRRAVRDVLPDAIATFAFWPALSHPCLQVADYYAWAVQRRVKDGEDRWYRMVEHQFRADWSL